jgi:RNA recognition motif-containing protein
MKNAILQTGRLFLRNLSFTCTEDELLELFKPFGEISQVSILSMNPSATTMVVDVMTVMNRDSRSFGSVDLFRENS